MSLDHRRALDTSRSVVVEACAGSGKTWLLSSRITRALIEGVPPESILALTFTNKAAAEMRNRVIEHLREMAGLGEADLRDKLVAWGFSEAALEQAVKTAPRAFEALLKDPKGPTISTFHSWYVKLLAMSPISMAGWGNMLLSRQSWRLMRDAWRMFFETHAVHTAYAELVAIEGSHAVRGAMEGWVRMRVEWQAFARKNPPVPSSVADARANLLSALAQNEQAVKEFFKREAQRATRLVRAYEGSDKRGRDLHDALLAWPEQDTGILESALLTRLDHDKQWQSDPPRRFQVKWADKFVRQSDRDRWGGQAAEIEAELYRFAQVLIDLLDDNDRRRGRAVTAALWTCSQKLAQCMGEVMLASNELDYAGLELAAWNLLGGEGAEEFHARLDTRIRHVLIDEFQDTNPVQWAMIKAWFSQYCQADEQMRAQAPRVFLVGDPKQSIYRFRRADPQVFEIAAQWLAENFDAEILKTNTTRRCADEIVQALNVFLPGAAGGRYEPHDTLALHAGFAARLPVIGKADDEKYVKEGHQIAKAIAEIAKTTKNFMWSQATILSRTRTHMADYEAALQAHGIPFVSDRSGGLFLEPEVDDVIALLRTLAFPWSDADLAQTLKSPVFGLGDHDLVVLAQARLLEGHSSLWKALSSMAAKPGGRAAPQTVLCEAFDALSRFRQWSMQLPVHDLLDRIIHERDVLDRIALRFSARRGLQCVANLEAFIAQALELDTGRLPSLPRFLQELDRWTKAEDPDSPGPGQLPGVDAVRLTTLHSAKGLEADVVIFAGMMDRDNSDSGVRWMIHWNEGRDAMHGVAAWQSSDAFDEPAISALRDDARQQDDENFNLLYVGLTRAKKVLLLSAVEERKDGWYTLAENAIPLWNPDQPLCEFRDQAFVTALGASLGERADRDADGPVRMLGLRQWRGERFGKPDQWPMPGKTEETMAIRQGKAFHRLLELGAGSPVGQSSGSGHFLKADRARIDRALAGYALDEPSRQAVIDALLAIAGAPRVQEFFKPEHLAYVEQEWLSETGEVFRPDRVVRLGDTPEQWQIVDFKWRVLDSEKTAYTAQLLAYQSEFVRMRPRSRVDACIVTASAEIWSLNEGRLVHLA